MADTQRLAVILFNLGGPANLAEVHPFLLSLFSDPAILRVPGWLRLPLAHLIAARRAPVARQIYAKLGGGSPILAQTQAQAQALENLLRERTRQDVRVFIAMRHAAPRAAQAAREVADFAPSRIVLLPLYPQFSTTTTQSSLDDWAHHARLCGLGNIPAQAVDAYPAQAGLIEALTQGVRKAWEELRAKGHQTARILFSAHGLPEKIVAAGDPYPKHCESTAAALRHSLADIPNLDSVLCYQSRVGPLAWIGPSTESELRRAGSQGSPVIVVPIAFVSEHSETLVELDMEGRDLALEAGSSAFIRVPTPGTSPAFIAGLAQLVEDAVHV
ncbi:MAG: ferrochelatase [Alphaproteobacteria bacterium]|nr:MAG: ferrochelatase [Alphaproteobacteria bacterium]